ncbi:MAG: glycosyltransferase family 4 protein [Bacteroidia bacterium]|nr:glycosyltransferase family 4 protein [Bacteroidia bacterium]
MNVLIVSTSDIHGGAAIAAFRLMNALNANGVNAKMIVREKLSGSDTVFQVGSEHKNKWNFYWERGKIFLKNRLSRENLFDISIANTGISITSPPEFTQADVIHLHWNNQGMLSVDEIGKILASGKKIVWTMHDMWAFTGICHHAGVCKNYEKSCGSCPYLVSASQNDLSHQVFLKKQTAYKNGKITFVACSNWLKSLAEKSPLTKEHSVVTIPNPIDTRIYFPKDKSEVRKKMNLPDDKKIVLFAAVKTSDPRKGMEYLAKASEIMAQHPNNVLFLIAGNNGKELEKQLSLPAHSLGFIAPENMLDVYNAADVFVTPSLQENLPNTIMEAMACGTPCVGFDIGGIPEMISHGKNGYVATYKSAEELANGLLWTLYKADSETLSTNAREKVLSEYAQEHIAKRYIELYNA